MIVQGVCHHNFLHFSMGIPINYKPLFATIIRKGDNPKYNFKLWLDSTYYAGFGWIEMIMKALQCFTQKTVVNHSATKWLWFIWRNLSSAGHSVFSWMMISNKEPRKLEQIAHQKFWCLILFHKNMADQTSFNKTSHTRQQTRKMPTGRVLENNERT